MSGDRKERGDAKRALLKEARRWLSQDAKSAFKLSRRPLLSTLSFSAITFLAGVGSITLISILEPPPTEAGGLLGRSVNILLILADEFLFDALSAFDLVKMDDYATAPEKLVVFSYTICTAMLAGRLVGYLMQCLLTIVVISILPLTALRKAKEIRTHTNEYGLRSSPQVIEKKGPRSVQRRKLLNLVGLLLDFQENVWEQAIEPRT